MREHDHPLYDWFDLARELARIVRCWIVGHQWRECPIPEPAKGFPVRVISLKVCNRCGAIDCLVPQEN